MKIDLKNYHNQNFLYIKDILSKYTNRAYFVGGFVRDIFLGITSKDIDIEVYDINPFEFDEIMKSISAKGVGKKYFVYKYKNYDISLPRTETKTGVGHKAFEVEICNDEELASKRRDFTINSIMINIFSGEILDFYGGLEDLKLKRLKVVNKDSFIEDSLRVLRGVGFASRFDLIIDEESFKIMKNMSLDDLSIDRISGEFKKIFKAKYQDKALKILYELDLIEFLFLTKIEKKEVAKISTILKEGLRYIKNEMFFLYIFLNYLNLDKEKVLKRLSLNTVYKRVIDEPYFDNPSDFDLLKVSLATPLKNWLGLYSDELIKRAKSLGVYEYKFKSKVTAKDVIQDGFSGPDISKELNKRRECELKTFLKNKDR
ncbi:multifunctional tRNA nucleotidyl transferase / 2'3'-cyclic phosphodiesterase / 2'nucleotidase / phosphatase [Campylobacter blaseri]|uniref:CCA tRNA nucleotidyltransferase n=1 Tax=Campylobacter blaseri TaxID=2042961 RepID=UPI00155DBB19|nr:CCA tRNA nucleotidyltransferase [Campylobacter blaseri]QKF85892.1 multifunctional tRNA nucleotidyl transferase / 2'3'-cyclic phosphodiesterase / 2'nucleotidase / phosphatase [Campylobacter blaseri]